MMMMMTMVTITHSKLLCLFVYYFNFNAIILRNTYESLYIVTCKSMSTNMAHNIKHKHLTVERRSKAGRINWIS